MLSAADKQMAEELDDVKKMNQVSAAPLAAMADYKGAARCCQLTAFGQALRHPPAPPAHG